MGKIGLITTQIVVYLIVAFSLYVYIVYYKDLKDLAPLMYLFGPILFLFAFSIIMVTRYTKKRNTDRTTGIPEKIINYNYTIDLKIDIITVLITLGSLFIAYSLEGELSGANAAQAGITFGGMYLIKNIIIRKV